MASQNSAIDSVQVLPVDACGMIQTLAAIELYRAQREVANYLQLAYLKLANMPDVARQVRETANNARMQHLMTNGLMKKFTLTARHILDTMIPMILDAVELQDKDIIVGCFAQIIEMAKDMRKEAQDTRERYIVIQTQVQGNIATIGTKRKEVLDENKRRAIEMERQKELLKASKLKEKQLKEEKEKMDKELENLKQYRDQIKEDSVNILKKQGKDDEESSFLDAAIVPCIALGGNIGLAIGVIGVIGAVNLFKSIFDKKKVSKVQSTQEAFKNSQVAVERLYEKNQDLISHLYDERVNALQRLAKIRTLANAEVGICNAESLREASAYLGTVDKQFTRIIEFWNNMEAVLEFLKNDTKAGEVYLKKIENPKHAERFKKSISRSKQGWSTFGRICQDYIVESDSKISILYAFLSSPIDSMTADDRKKRIQEVMQVIEDDINSALPEQT